ncbi:MAG: hypothetical protein JO302_04900 [Candidatus Eremiobacteraeota bacterium]|nr:hypothetical protein [Candidatus Eremiobacteraeota bacterium]
MTVRLGALLVALAVAGCAHKSAVTTQSAGGTSAAGGTIVAAAGTIFYGELDRPIGTKISHDGDPFILSETSKLARKSLALAGAVVDAHVEGVRPAGPMRNPAMTIVFDDIRLTDGTKEPVNVSVVSMKEFDPKTHHLRTIGMMIGGAIAGHMAAAHAGVRHGTFLGAVGGYMLSQSLKTDVSVPAGTVVELRFKQPVTSNATSP